MIATLQTLLVERVRNGDEDAFYELIQHVYTDLYRIAFVYIQHEADTVEVLQQAMIRGYEHIHNLQEPKYFKTWMIRIVINCSKTLLEKRKKVDIVDPFLLQDVKVAVPTYVEEELDLWQALSTLEEKYKTVLVLRFYQDYTVSEISKITDLPEGTVKTNIRRGLRKLRQLLKGAYTDEWFQSAEKHHQ